MAFNYRKELYRYRHYYQQLEPVLHKPQTTAYTMLILSLVTIAFFGFFAIRPTLSTITALRKEIEDSRTINEQFDRKIESLIAAQESYQSIQPQLPTIFARVPQDAQFSLLVQQLENLTASYDATLSALQFQSLPLQAVSSKEATSPATAALLTEAEPFTLSISVEGTYPQLRQFLQKLIGLSRLIIIKQIDIATVDGDRLRLSLLLESFFLP